MLSPIPHSCILMDVNLINIDVCVPKLKVNDTVCLVRRHPKANHLLGCFLKHCKEWGKTKPPTFPSTGWFGLAGFLVAPYGALRRSDLENLQGYNWSNHQAEELTCFLCCKKMKPLFCVENWEISGVFHVCFFWWKKHCKSQKSSQQRRCRRSKEASQAGLPTTLLDIWELCKDLPIKASSPCWRT